MKPYPLRDDYISELEELVELGKLISFALSPRIYRVIQNDEDSRKRYEALMQTGSIKAYLVSDMPEGRGFKTDGANSFWYDEKKGKGELQTTIAKTSRRGKMLERIHDKKIPNSIPINNFDKPISELLTSPISSV